MDEELLKLKEQAQKQVILIYTPLPIVSLILYIYILSNIPAELAVNLFFILLLMFIGLNVLYIIAVKAPLVKHYKMRFKEEYIKNLIESKGYFYSVEGFKEEEITDTQFFNFITSFKSDDLVYGTLSDVKFKNADVEIGIGEGKAYRKVFHGQWFIFDFNKRFENNTHIYEVDEETIFDNIIKPVDLVKIKTEYKRFDQQFKIFTDSKLEAMYLITPHFMESIIKLDEKYPGRLFMIFHNNQLHIGIHTLEGRFEAPFFEEFEQDVFLNQIDDLNMIKAIIDDLRLNQRIFM